MSKKESRYKPFGETAFRKMLAKDLEKNIDKFNDPLIIGEMLHLLLEERESTNRLFKTLIEKLDRMEARIENSIHKSETKETHVKELLPEVDRKIITFVKKKGYVTADDVRKRFGYKGTNAASARLNRLCALGQLSKKQVGRKVYFMTV